MARGRRLLGRALGALLGALVLLPALFAVTAVPAHADPGSEEAQFLALTNQLRASHGLTQLSTDGTLLSIARGWSANMAAAGAISHNMNLPNEVTSVYWSKLGENVGTGWDVQSIQTAFINSPHHYANLVDPSYNYVGIGVVDSGGKIYVTVDFMAYNGQAAPAPARAAAPTTRTTRVAVRTAPRPAAAAPVATAPAPTPTPAPEPESPTPRTPTPGLILALAQVRAVDSWAPATATDPAPGG
jgi:hypothetical protein